MVAHETVDETACPPPGEGARDGGLGARGQRLPISLAGAGLGAEEEGRANLDGRGAGFKGCPNRIAVGDPARGDEGKRCADLGEQLREGRLVLSVVPGASMAAGLGPLDDEYIRVCESIREAEYLRDRPMQLIREARLRIS